MLKESLCQIGLTASEADVYLELLRLGSQPASVVSKRLGINRSSSYVVLKSLLVKGLICSHQRGGITYYSPSDPNSIIAYLDQKSRTFDYYKSQMKKMLPRLRAFNGESVPVRPVVSFHDGVEGVKTVMYDALSSRGVFRSYFAIDAWFKCGLDEFLAEYTSSRISKSRVPLRAIIPNTKIVKGFCAKHYSKKDLLTEFLFVDPDGCKGMFDNEMSIYNDTVFILNLVPGSEYAIVIESKEIACMQRLLFDKVYSSNLDQK